MRHAAGVSYSTSDARKSLLGEVAASIEALARAFALFGVAYELVDEAMGDRLEEQLYGPTQKAYAALRRTHAAYAARYALEPRSFEPPDPSGGRADAREVIDRAVEALEQADAILVEIQDSGLGVEAGDRESRAAVSDVRRQIDPLPARAETLLSLLGR